MFLWFYYVSFLHLHSPFWKTRLFVESYIHPVLFSFLCVPLLAVYKSMRFGCRQDRQVRCVPGRLMTDG